MKNLPLAINVMFVGVLVVFLALGVLIGAIYIFSKLLYKKNGSTEFNDGDEHAPNDTIDIIHNDIIHNDIVANNSNSISEEELVVVLTAAIQSFYNKTGVQTKIRVRSFKRIPDTSLVWNSISRSEYISEKL